MACIREHGRSELPESEFDPSLEQNFCSRLLDFKLAIQFKKISINGKLKLKWD